MESPALVPLWRNLRRAFCYCSRGICDYRLWEMLEWREMKLSDFHGLPMPSGEGTVKVIAFDWPGLSS